ncbi:inactive peptidyl-prolyl cis-trans isomerase FKBP6 [Tenrec ecaudatus]|uniref:inactive peptidyl-prolyl cis-trans isomerase FKBP6 n=1 Tax=Tenrec ecaudatus TaxID=94439 RepID=UPI003F5AA13A
MSASSRPLSRMPPLEESPYQRLSQRMLDISGDRGVLKDVLREGTGDLVAPDASVLVKYSGYLEHMDKPFDSNCFRKTPRLMKLGEDITLWGMELGLLTMRRGELARFLFKPTYAYGVLGCPPLIPPNTTVLFEIELLDFLDSAESDSFFALTAEQQDQFPLQKVLKVATTEREFGNYLFRQSRFYDAKARYKRALLLLRRRSGTLGEQHLVEADKLLVLLNLSFTYLKLGQHPQALRYGEQALTINQKNAKALFRCGQACLLMTEYEKARDFLVRAQREQPFNHDISNELKKLARDYRVYTDKEREMCHRMFAPEDGGVAREDVCSKRRPRSAAHLVPVFEVGKQRIVCDLSEVTRREAVGPCVVLGVALMLVHGGEGPPLPRLPRLPRRRPAPGSAQVSEAAAAISARQQSGRARGAGPGLRGFGAARVCVGSGPGCMKGPSVCARAAARLAA